MNKVMKWGMVFLLSMAVCGNAMAAFVLNGTRFIYEEGKKNLSFEVTNQAEETFGGQVWVDNTNQGDGVYMVPAPPFFKIGANQKQIVRIMKTDSRLPTDRESLFWLNVQEIPPKPKTEDKNVLSVAVNTKVKLIYRPKSLIEGRKEAEKNVRVIHNGGKTYLSNPTPYYFAVIGVKVNGQAVKLSSAEQNALAQMAPLSEVLIGKHALNGTVTIDAVNDWGGVDSYTLLKG
ncbi:fimbrial chaperone [Yersinia similis]|uniref:Fimbrial chaperone protein n=1 Tax=Yersinia similis TaxID=367190 RepID=A0A0T9RA94_9GAMM|nr:fimbrial chaperone [Yersinia similis]AHK19618.1 fimbrial chaperone protein [Yersinia similis]CFQ61948.1 fimbrial chaperone protein [Yersinia similis]CNC45829.1 fimbrial chaperone protein [Yersinia similis]CNE33135.1 fimbrial chaperone protein [Yersinia similis]CNG36860.1 fimbrial chaperone protein [Yersinia similis]